MFDFLNYFGNKVVGRYKTVETNIRMRSNSFYDSFLDLVEETVKSILIKEKITYNGRTCGEILKESAAADFFKCKLNVQDEYYNKIIDYVKKINEHKHNQEKYVNIDTVINYLCAFYNFVMPYFKMKNIPISEFNGDFLKGIYGITLERSKELENVSNKVDDFVSSTNKKIDEQNIRIEILEAWSKEFSNRQLDTKQDDITISKKSTTVNKIDAGATTQWFLKTSKKSWRWFGNKRNFKKEKLLTIFAHTLLLIIGIASTIVTSLSLKTYSAFTLFENIWLVFVIILLIYAAKAKIKCDSGKLAKNTRHTFKQDKYGLWNPKKEKIVFKIFKWLAIVAIFFNVAFIWTKMNNLSVSATILEILFLGAIVFSLFMDDSLFSQYTIIYLEGKIAQNREQTTIVFDPIANKFFLEEDYKKQMPFFFDK